MRNDDMHICTPFADVPGTANAGERSRWASVVRALFSKMIQIFSGNSALLERHDGRGAGLPRETSEIRLVDACGPRWAHAGVEACSRLRKCYINCSARADAPLIAQYSPERLLVEFEPSSHGARSEKNQERTLLLAS